MEKYDSIWNEEGASISLLHNNGVEFLITKVQNYHLHCDSTMIVTQHLHMRQYVACFMTRIARNCVGVGLIVGAGLIVSTAIMNTDGLIVVNSSISQIFQMQSSPGSVELNYLIH